MIFKYNISNSEDSRIGGCCDLGQEARRADKLFTPHCKQTCKFEFNENQQPTRANNARASSFFYFFESSMISKIGPVSRSRSRACGVSGRALSEGGFALSTPLEYFASEQVPIRGLVQISFFASLLQDDHPRDQGGQ